MKSSRRDFLLATSGLAMFGNAARTPVWASSLGGYPFRVGVASGDPLPDGFVIWTRLVLEPLQSSGGMPMKTVPVTWEVAEDEAFRRIIRSGEAFARPELGHSVHVEVEGLAAARPYWYRFTAAGERSPSGTVRTAPAAGDLASRVRLAVAGCNHYEAGYFTAFRHLSEVPELDAVFHYGDYIYEGYGGRGNRNGWDDTWFCVRPHVGDELYSLDDYRRRYAQYKSDPDLMAAHAAAAFLVTFDDHEIDNNWAADNDESGTAPEVFVLRRFAALQAWYENMPVRKAQFPRAGGLRAFRRLDYGDLLRIHLLDTRQYRSKHLCLRSRNKNCRAPEADAPVTMLGADQEAWLEEGLSRQPRWHLLAQQVQVLPRNMAKTAEAPPVHGIDNWDGYAPARARLVRAITERGLTNVVVSSGDAHMHLVGTVPIRDDAPDGPAAATEFLCTSITSNGDGADQRPDWGHVLARNPHIRLFNDRRGYQLFDVTSRAWETELRVLDKVQERGGVTKTLARFAVDPRKPGLRDG